MKSVGLIIQLVLLTNYLVFESYALHRVSDLSHNHNHNQNATNNSSSLLVPKNKGSKKNKNGKSSSAKNHKHRISNRNTKRVQKHTTSRPDGSEDYMSSTNNKIEVINVTAKVGETVILSCAINSSYGSNPGVIWMQGKLGNVLTLNTNRITLDSRFDVIQHAVVQKPAATVDEHNQLGSSASSFNDYLATSLQQAYDHHHHNQLASNKATNEPVSYYNLRIENVQLYDENEYACETSLTKRDDDQPSLHSLINLQITQSPSFIESQTSESNLIALEHADLTLKCFAVGKPSPKIKWYQLDEETNFIKDLNHESNSLIIKNVSKSENHKYECVASNGILPSVSKKITLTVYFTPSVSPIKSKVTHSKGQTALLGCTIVSNPDSSVNWLKLNPSFNKTLASTNTTNSSGETLVASGEPEYLLVDVANPRYQIHKYKQANQTVSYFKIKNLEDADLGKYKCEASNIVGRSEAVIELAEQLEASNRPNSKESFQSRARNNEYEEDPLLASSSYENYHYYNGEAENIDKSKAKGIKNSNSTQKHGPKKYANRLSLGTSNNNNRTLARYQMNKPNRLVETESRRVKDFTPSSSYTNVHSSLLILLATSTAVWFNKYIK